MFAEAGHDDGLFISHAMSIVSEHWLGPYSQFTFMKGPGYPLFLAFISLFRIPVTIAHAVCWGFSIWLLSYATHRIFTSVLLAVIVLEILLWNFGPHSMRIIRDELTTPQLIIVFSFLLLALFASNKPNKMLLYASLSGGVFGWFRMTREDTVVAVPALLVLFLCSFHKTYNKERSIKWPLKVLGAFLLSSSAVWAIVAFINLAEYKTLSIVDFNGSFEKALEALEVVKPDTHIAYDLVPRSARDKVYKVSPTFSQLRELLEFPNSPIAAWKAPSCSIYPATCGDYGAWFMWALRDAVAVHGDYSSPQAAATFYRKVHDEIKRACDARTISCYHTVLPYIPHVDRNQLTHAAGSLQTALLDLSFLQPPPESEPSSIGSDDSLRRASSFLNLQNHTPPPASEVIANQNLVVLAEKLRASLIRFYGEFLPPFLTLGFAALLILLLRSVISRSYSIGLAIGLSAWLAVLCRVILVVLVDISSFPAVDHLYIGYAYSFICYASIISVFLVTRWLLEGKRDEAEHLSYDDFIAMS